MKVEKIISEHDPIIVAVVADSHIPDRVDNLHPSLLNELVECEVTLILHAGDISVKWVTTQLEQIAPVKAVTGNRDILLSNELPNVQRLDVFGSTLVLTHGHLNPATYWMDKFQYVTRGYSFERYQKRFKRAFPEARVVVFGHTHHAENCWLNGQLFFNPGSVSHGDYLDRTPSYGLLKFFKDGRIEAEVIPLMGAEIRAKRWVDQR